MNKILLDSEPVETFDVASLPMLIHGKEGSGASLYTIAVAANWYSQGSHVLFLCGYSMAEEVFNQQIESTHPDARFYTQDKLSEFTSVMGTVANNTLVVVKNIELFDKDTFLLIHRHSKLIISGDIEETSFKDELLHHPFMTKIYFSELHGTDVPQLEKYSGFVEAGEYKGITKLS
jgi:hypothetical protein